VSWVADASRVQPWGIDGPPDLAVAVRSPSTWRLDVGTKKRVYEERGLTELWLVDTEADVVLVFRRSSADAPVFDVALEFTRGETLTSPLLEGFALAVDDLFGR
jgi:Uma2 family endonuclease